MVLSLLFTTQVSAASLNNKGLLGNDAESAKESQIMGLFDERQTVLFQKPVDIKKLNEIDIQLSALGVDFLTLKEVEEQFPEAKADRIKALQGKTSAVTDSGDVIHPNVSVPDSNVNTWASYRTTNYNYNGQYYNIQKLIAQPTSENSGLWEEGSRTVNFSVNWKAGVTNLIESLAWTAAGTIASIPVSVYDALSSVWDGLKTTSDIDPSDVIYSWETQTTAVFAYVRLQSQTDDYQYLSHISTKCVTEVAYIVDVDSWRQNGTGAWVVYPNLESGTRYLYHTPSYYSSTSEAVNAYLNAIGGPWHAAISEIKISGPESKTVQSIYPCYPQFPLHCE